MNRTSNLLRLLLTWLVLMTIASAAQAHKSSDSYLQIDATAKGLAVRWDIALRDLDNALDIDTNDDGKLTWGEVKAAWPGIERYSMARLRIEGCPLRLTGRALERRNDGAYAVMFLASDCVLKSTPRISYTLFRDIDPTHRGIAKVQRAGVPLALMLLDPTQDASSASANGLAPTPGVSNGPWAFLQEGIRHILGGYDHVLFLLCLLLPSVMQRTPQGWKPVDRLSHAVWPVLGLVSAFTLAHSITLALAATKVVSLPSAVIEPAIAVTIILAALDNVWPIFPVKRVIVAFLFGLVHGFGFAGVLAELNLPTMQFVWALLQFNIGLELGQLMIVVSVTAVLFLLRKRPQYRGWAIRGGSMVAMLIGALWLIERVANVSILSI
ncbi:MAG: HupE/UreJ family protein [Betaproteobacteria bacterium]|nr:HupE/UreJ family protein [Betaproteobacteria bacterium]MDE2048247.1 HupE/UreJ family protein [Betaproteobacteria bacterium]